MPSIVHRSRRRNFALERRKGLRVQLGLLTNGVLFCLSVSRSLKNFATLSSSIFKAIGNSITQEIARKSNLKQK